MSTKEYQKKYYQENKEKSKEYQKKYYQENKEKSKEYRKKYCQENKEKSKECQQAYQKTKKYKLSRKNRILKLYYGITLIEYNKILVKQKHRCAICRIHKSKLTQSLCVDHSHKTKKVRGLLCTKCNTALGLFKDNPKLLIKASKYLTTNHKVEAWIKQQ